MLSYLCQKLLQLLTYLPNLRKTNGCGLSKNDDIYIFFLKRFKLENKKSTRQQVYILYYGVQDVVRWRIEGESNWSVDVIM